jgi:carnitine O-palmitoyltransferase 1
MLPSWNGFKPLKIVIPFLLWHFFRHLESVRPLCDDNEFNKFVQWSQEFESTLGKKLQRWLQLKWWTSDNYVSDWWEEYVYLRGKLVTVHILRKHIF